MTRLTYPAGTLFTHIAVEVDPDGMHIDPQAPLINRSYQSSKMLERFSIPLTWVNDLDGTSDALDAIWDAYPYGEKTLATSKDSKVTITADGAYQYPGDPDMTPVLVLTCEAKGFVEKLYFYNHEFIAYVRDGVLISHGRMD